MRRRIKKTAEQVFNEMTDFQRLVFKARRGDKEASVEAQENARSSSRTLAGIGRPREHVTAGRDQGAGQWGSASCGVGPAPCG